ncbi:hypothetical protein TNCV_794481 [Trichonephila clavipes]|nr:hypothetical protein TNCV_794481 [Trichonephila clavipes]
MRLSIRLWEYCSTPQEVQSPYLGQCSFKHVLHQTSSMRSRFIILENKGISNGSSVRDDMRLNLFNCIPSALQSAIRMICKSVRPPMLIPKPSNQLFCIVNLSRTNAGLFRVPYPPYKNTSGVTL